MFSNFVRWDAALNFGFERTERHSSLWVEEHHFSDFLGFIAEVVFLKFFDRDSKFGGEEFDFFRSRKAAAKFDVGQKCARNADLFGEFS